MRASNLNDERYGWGAKADPLISFPIATYNRIDVVVERTLPSILNQSYKNLEVVIVGDCISKSDWARLQNTIKDKRVKFFNLKSRTIYPQDGLSFWCVAGYRPRNIAARISSGDWHWWISDDDELIDGAVDKVIDYMKFNKDVESIYGNYMICESGGMKKRLTESNSKTGLPFPITGIPSWINRNYLSRLYRWSGLSYLNVVNKPSDYDMQFRMNLDGVRFGYVDEDLSTVHQAIPSRNLQGSQAYIQCPELFK